MARMRIGAVVGLTVILAACGGAATAESGPVSATPGESPALLSQAPPSPSSAPAGLPGTTLTDADNGATVSVVVGQHVKVELAPEAGVYAWRPPRLTGPALRLLSVAGGYPDRRPMQAVFLAVTPGTAVISAVSDMPCLHAHPRCAAVQRVWTATAIVVNRP